MKKLLLAASILHFASPAYSQSVYRSTTCNVYYNNRGRVFEGVQCKAWFSNQRLVRVNVYLPHANRWYDWSTKYSDVTPDPRWNECLRHTGVTGDQYQICTQKSPEELNIR
jgi:hypothetical protein